VGAGVGAGAETGPESTEPHATVTLVRAPLPRRDAHQFVKDSRTESSGAEAQSAVDEEEV
jgi:hypothetical protein